MDVKIGAIDDVAFLNSQNFESQVHQENLFGKVLELDFLLKAFFNIVNFHQIGHFDV